MLKVLPRYFGTVALDVNYNVYKGKINTLVGENGAGKSTLMKILAGIEQSTKGRILLEGEVIYMKSPQDARNLGIGMIYQELDLCENMSIAENIFLANEPTRYNIIDERIRQKRTIELIQRFEQKLDPNTLVKDLRIGEKQIVAIAKALSLNTRILIMDEPTSALSTTEVEVLFRLMKRLKSEGITIIYISHKLDEILRIGDCITVLRDGSVVGEELIENVDMDWIIEKMIGKKLNSLFVHKEHEIGEVIFRVEDITLPGISGGYTVDHVSFELHSGEIIGIYGLKGAGRSEMLECLAGTNPLMTGKVYLEGQEIVTSTTLKCIQSGLVLVPEDRQRDGLVPTLSVAHNIVLASLEKYLNRFRLFLVEKKEKEAVNNMIEELSIKVSDPGDIVVSLSGGNQQKVIIAKSLLTDPKVLMLDEPTRGIDIGAKHEVFEIMGNLAAKGYGVLFVSSESKEILAMSDRIIVMSKGKITGEFTREEATEEKLIKASVAGNNQEKMNKKQEVK